MNRSERTANIAAGTSFLKSDTASAVSAVFHTIFDALAGGETVTIAAARRPSFWAGKALRNAANR